MGVVGTEQLSRTNPPPLKHLYEARPYGGERGECFMGSVCSVALENAAHAALENLCIFPLKRKCGQEVVLPQQTD